MITAGAVNIKNVLLRLVWFMGTKPITSFLIFIIVGGFYYGIIKPGINGVHDCSKGTGNCRWFSCDEIFDDGWRDNDLIVCVRDNHGVPANFYSVWQDLYP